MLHLDQVKGDVVMDKVAAFVNAVSQSTDPSIHWIVCHSTAVAIGTSGILREEFMSEKSDFKTMRLNLFLSVLTFLQDSNDAAGKALSLSLQADSRPEANDLHPSMPHVPLMELEMTYRCVEQRHNDSDLTARLFNTILTECRQMQIKIDLALSETSERTQDANELLNQSSSRKIFEAEDSNPYSEALITCQLSVSILGHSSKQHVNEYVLGVMDTMTSECSKIIRLIKDRASQKASYDKDDITHNLTWCSEVFPAFHGLLLGAIASIYLARRNPGVVVKDAQGLLVALGENGQGATHPCILEALQVLSHASAGSDATKNGLLKACFLAPSICIPSSC